MNRKFLLTAAGLIASLAYHGARIRETRRAFIRGYTARMHDEMRVQAEAATAAPAFDDLRPVSTQGD